MFNIIFPIIIFVSLAIIVFIVGKHLPEFVDIKRKEENSLQKKEYIKNILMIILKTTKNVSIWLLEQIVKGAKNFLNLIQSWIIDNKKKKEEKNFKTENFDQKEKTENDFLKKITKKEVVVEKVEETEEDFFDVKKIKPEKIKRNFFADFKNRIKEKVLEKKRQKINQVFQENDEYEEDLSQFSDGIVKIHEKKKNNTINKQDLIKEVVEVDDVQNDKMNLDDEIGVDRQILEKKLIHKIAQNPKDKENYRQLGELYLKMENYLDSEGCYKQVLKMAFRDVDARRKIERIKLLKRTQKK